MKVLAPYEGLRIIGQVFWLPHSLAPSRPERTGTVVFSQGSNPGLQRRVRARLPRASLFPPPLGGAPNDHEQLLNHYTRVRATVNDQYHTIVQIFEHAP